ncbi:MAG: tRNA (5-methylaminomethyl-2-thiouridine)(34)-methyltransferase MnmD [Candidatus Omnitrophica bacterium]|nr:tRNA (5-methylaminomethyl-2-thiouridine)(34)-methyltransferase MnmD [Candidatus Omnitrophota bacterium]
METHDVPIEWDQDGLPHSVIFNDKYFCNLDAYEEVLSISCQGNVLKDRFSKLDPSVGGTFTIIETGFGTGLNFCCAWQLWDQCAPKSWTLHFVSIELYPLSVQQLNRALSLWPVLSRYREALVLQYKPLPQETAQLFLADHRVRLTLVFEDVVEALRQIKERGITPDGADAWFLSGFAPAKNPKMWSEQVFEGMAPLSRQGTTFATFTVAGPVRRGLAANGFVVHKGFGYKKHIITGYFHGKDAS